MLQVSPTNPQSFDELVFDHRNQAYGAYVLRREYPGQVIKSFFIGMAIMAVMLAMPYFINTLSNQPLVKTQIPPYTTCILMLPEIPPEEDFNETKDPCGSRSVFTTPVVDPCDNSILPIHIEHAPVLPVVENSFNLDGFIEIEEGDTDYPAKEKPLIVDPSEVDTPPSFPGGEEAMHNFLNENLVYPQQARKIGLEGKVYITFVVDEFGNLTHIETPRPLGGGLDEEAIRVMKLMPRWNPGKLKGYPIKVKYTFPIIFQLN
jgi:protein TonB